MTGPEHFREAERLLSQSSSLGEDGKAYFLADSEGDVAAAQVHATLALASASAMAPVAHFMGDDPLVTEWGHLIGHQKCTSAVSS